MNPSTIAIVKQTVPLISASGNDITQQFYTFLFDENPQLKHVFNMANQASGKQQSSLASAILGYAANIDKLEALGPVVERIAAKHFTLDIQPEHYPIVGRNLLKAIRKVLGEDVATDEVISAWSDAYGHLADILIGVEKNLYEAAADHGWVGFKAFNVDRKVEQSSEITSFYLTPADGKPLPEFHPGQYLSLEVKSDSFPYTELRQYSLSDSSNKDYYRISVKKEPAPQENTPHGLVSNHLHADINVGDTLQVHVPGGDFLLKNTDKPLVLISGGVGITPLLSMLNDLTKRGDNRPIVWLHGTRNKATHAFKEHLNMLDADLPNLTKVVCYEDISHAEMGVDYNYSGYINTDMLSDLCPEDAEYYFCGPMPFMKAIYSQLKQLNINEEQLHYEVFGPNEAL
ncbi:NO-inducible flavohemoprotein [Neptunomonas antarctica]|uniref:Flavohemoprotein n=1 Tax=Neptunomonas antarctica TaxID=619304 RepID=A0A1N7K0J3_9GAMM|nr:NO-inducible flavohemoprotein [Neptunomonas antarctica]SIS55098.1 nitric oxide dioxygenase [Neptunomonas antarctica]